MVWAEIAPCFALRASHFGLEWSLLASAATGIREALGKRRRGAGRRRGGGAGNRRKPRGGDGTPALRRGAATNGRLRSNRGHEALFPFCIRRSAFCISGRSLPACLPRHGQATAATGHGSKTRIHAAQPIAGMGRRGGGLRQLRRLRRARNKCWFKRGELPATTLAAGCTVFLHLSVNSEDPCRLWQRRAGDCPPYLR